MAAKKTIETSVLEDLKTLLKKQPPKVPLEKTIAEALQELKPSILKLVDTGYSKEEILALLAEKGMVVKPYQFKEIFKKEKKHEQQETGGLLEDSGETSAG